MGQVQQAYTGVVNSIFGAAASYQGAQIKKELSAQQAAKDKLKTENLESKTNLNKVKAETLQKEAEDKSKYQEAKSQNLESKSNLNKIKAEALQQKAADNTKYQEARTAAIQEKAEMVKTNNDIKNEQDKKLYDAKLKNIEANTKNQESLTEKRNFRNRVEKNMFVQKDMTKKAINRIEEYNKTYQEQFAQIKRDMIKLYDYQRQNKQAKQEASQTRRQTYSNGKRSVEY